MAAIRKGDDHDLADAAHMDLEQIPGEHTQTEEEQAAEQKQLLRSSKIAKTMTVILTLALLILWPMPMYGSNYIFSKPFFRGWVVVGIIWLIGSLFCVGVFPVFEGRHALIRTVKYIYLDITGKQHPSQFHRPEATFIQGKSEGDGSDSPPNEKSEKEKEIMEKTAADAE